MLTYAAPRAAAAQPAAAVAPSRPAGGTAGGPLPDFSFARVGVFPLEDSPRVRVKREEAPPDAGSCAAPGGGQGGAASPADPGQGATPQWLFDRSGAQLAVSGAGESDYVDSAAESHKRPLFTVTIPWYGCPSSYCLVQEVNGYGKDGNGNYFQTLKYGAMAPMNHPDWEVDSSDPDPVMGSTPQSRWNYKSTGNGFTHYDDPGPAKSSERGAVYALRFRVAVYETSKVPTTTTGKLSVPALTIQEYWKYSVQVDANGGFSHPPI